MTLRRHLIGKGKALFEDTHAGHHESGASAGGSSALPGRVASTRRILVVLHQEHSSPGRVGRLLREAGYSLDIRRPRYGDPLPRTMHAHDAAIVFGGPMSCNDNEAWIRHEIDWIGVPLRAGKPYLGICLGAQMLARHLGHRVAPHPQGRVEVGFYPIRPTAHGLRDWSGLFPTKVYQWHREGFDLPAGATLLAEGDDFAAQAFRYGRGAYGLQFHPEVTYQMMCRWTTAGCERMDMPGALPRERHFRDWYQHDAAVADWLSAFLDCWTGHKAPRAMRPMTPQPRFA